MRAVLQLQWKHSAAAVIFLPFPFAPIFLFSVFAEWKPKDFTWQQYGITIHCDATH